MRKLSDWQRYVKEQSEKISNQQSNVKVHSRDTKDLQTVSSKTEVQRQPPSAVLPQVTIKKVYPDPIIVKPKDDFSSSKSSTLPFPPKSSLESEHTPKSPLERGLRGVLQNGVFVDKKIAAEKQIQQSDSAEVIKRDFSQKRIELLERLLNPTISLEEVAQLMGVCKATIRRYTEKGVLPHYRTVGNQRRFKLSDILNFIENQRKE